MLLSFVQDNDIRSFSRFDANISCQTVIGTILELVKLVEKDITSEINETKGASLFDGFSCSTFHYVAIISSYCFRHWVGTETMPRLSCMAVAPLGSVSEDGNEGAKSSRFDAESHYLYFKDVLTMYHLNFLSWVLCVSVIMPL